MEGTMINWSYGFKSSYHMCMVDPVTWKDKERLELESGSISRSDEGLRQSADIQPIEYSLGSDKFIRIWMDVRQGGESDRVALFTGMTSAPERKIDGASVDTPVICYSVLKDAQDIDLPRGWYAAKGIIATDIIADLLNVCRAPVTIEAGAPRLSQHIVAEDGENHLTMTDKILDVIGWRMSISGFGEIRIGPIASKISVTFGAAENDCIETPFTSKHDRFACPNVMRCIKNDEACIIRDIDPESELSIVRRGREIWKTENDVNLGDAESLETYTRRRLKELQSVALTASYNRSYDPRAYPSDMIRIHYPAQNVSGIFSIRSQKIQLDHCGTTAEEVDTA